MQEEEEDQEEEPEPVVEITWEEHKAQGTEKYKKADYAGAVESYSAAITLAPENHTLYGNRAAANMMRGKLATVVDDCRTSLQLEPTYTKGYGRCAKAYLQLVSISPRTPCAQISYELDRFNCWLILHFQYSFVQLVRVVLMSLRLAFSKFFVSKTSISFIPGPASRSC
jgi:hypothetical protein